MGIGDWLFGSKQEEPETTVRRAPTASELLASVERVEQTAREAKVPAVSYTHLDVYKRQVAGRSSGCTKVFQVSLVIGRAFGS